VGIRNHFQRKGSFKERSARNALLVFPSAQKQQGVIAASAGIHALGFADHGRLLGIPVTVVISDYAPVIKITAGEELGAKFLALCTTLKKNGFPPRNRN
jgi:threonine dehydratase